LRSGAIGSQIFLNTTLPDESDGLDDFDNAHHALIFVIQDMAVIDRFTGKVAKRMRMVTVS
jgi:hypothetical protein